MYTTNIGSFSKQYLEIFPEGWVWGLSPEGPKAKGPSGRDIYVTAMMGMHQIYRMRCGAGSLWWKQSCSKEHGTPSGALAMNWDLVNCPNQGPPSTSPCRGGFEWTMAVRNGPSIRQQTWDPSTAWWGTAPVWQWYLLPLWLRGRGLNGAPSRVRPETGSAKQMM